MSRIRVLIVDDHAILRDGIRALLGLAEDIEVVGEAADGAEALEACRKLEPDVALMDIAMPGLGGLEATLAIRREVPRTRVLVLTQYEDREYVARFLKAGVSGYVLKRAAGAERVERGAGLVGEPVGGEVLRRVAERLGEVGFPDRPALSRHGEDQVEVQVVESGGAGGPDRGARVVGVVDATERAQEIRLEGLDPEREAVHARGAETGEAGPLDGPRVRLERHLDVGCERARRGELGAVVSGLDIVAAAFCLDLKGASTTK